MDKNKILTPLQENFLALFFKESGRYDFYLVGGTALSAFYLEHRLSDDIDLFSDTLKFLEDTTSLQYTIDTIAQSLKCFSEVIDESKYHCRYKLVKYDQSLRIDLACDPCPRLRQIEVIEGIPVMSKDDIAANKIRTISKRQDIKDFIDLYFLNRNGYTNKTMVKLAQEKDPQIDSYKIRRGLNRFIHVYERQGGTIKFPKMLAEFDSGDFKRYIDGFSKELSVNLHEEIEPDFELK
ncbi:MAG: nucleotidyl transferase AbiEii/AbiGii toxin family protein [Nitrospinae bacterium]|nr:nucleotidyl transferase AbiEii/AbiGii toxin family protein [Nitrospinota bacterium]